jgi:phosphoribosylglycinamide formyltransferase 1
MIRIAVFASGSGTNAENIARYFKDNALVQIQLILTNNDKAGVIDRAKNLNIPVEIFSKNNFNDTDGILNRLIKEKIDFIVLAGFLLLVPDDIILKYKGRIINIHPALLPLHGGKGFYGSNVHQAVISSGAIMSGITIHHVNEKFDEGEIIFQAACHVSKNETAQSLAEKIHEMEYAWYPVVIEKLIRNFL